MNAETPQRGSPELVLVRRSGQGWQVGPEETADLTSAMVLADLLAADLGSPAAPPSGPLAAPAAGPPAARQGVQGGQGGQGGQGVAADEAARLAVTVAQLEHALSARVRVEQAIGVLAERHRLRPRQAFDLLRNVARSRGQKVTEIAEAVVDSTANPLLPLPEELARKQPAPRRRGRSPRHAARSEENVSGSR
jgi:ANTAR domain-containing protein